MEPIVLVHGGAGDIPDSRDTGKLIGCKLATRRGFDKLLATGSVLEAVEEAVRSMELDEYFNAGTQISVNYNYQLLITVVQLTLWFSTYY